MLRPYQQFSVERGSVEWENSPKIRKIRINSSKYFTGSKFNNYNCEKLEVREYTIKHNDSAEYLTELMAERHNYLKLFTLYDTDNKWLIYKLTPVKYQGEESIFYESDSRLIDCSERYNIMRNDGTLGTLIFRENGIMQFVVWP